MTDAASTVAVADVVMVDVEGNSSMGTIISFSTPLNLITTGVAGVAGVAVVFRQNPSIASRSIPSGSFSDLVSNDMISCVGSGVELKVNV